MPISSPVISERLKVLADELFAGAKTVLGEEWNELSAEQKQDILLTSSDLAALYMAQAAGANVSAEVAHAKAAMANWTFVGASKVRKVWLGLLEILTESLGGLLKGLLS